MPPYCRGSKHQKNGLAPLEERKRLCDPPNLPNLISVICLFPINMQPLALFLRKEPGGLSSISADLWVGFLFLRRLIGKGARKHTMRKRKGALRGGSRCCGLSFHPGVDHPAIDGMVFPLAAGAGALLGKRTARMAARRLGGFRGGNTGFLRRDPAFGSSLAAGRFFAPDAGGAVAFPVVRGGGPVLFRLRLLYRRGAGGN